jgi:predicted outer membrane protein
LKASQADFDKKVATKVAELGVNPAAVTQPKPLKQEASAEAAPASPGSFAKRNFTAECQEHISTHGATPVPKK